MTRTREELAEALLDASKHEYLIASFRSLLREAASALVSPTPSDDVLNALKDLQRTLEAINPKSLHERMREAPEGSVVRAMESNGYNGSTYRKCADQLWHMESGRGGTYSTGYAAERFPGDAYELET